MSTEGSPVLTFEWDLSGDVIGSVVRHIGILVFGTFYEYSSAGIIRTKVLPGDLPPTPEGGTPSKAFGVELGRTKLAESDFNDWVTSQSLNQFKVGNYNAAFNNCIFFAAKACRYLGITAPIRWTIAASVITGSFDISLPVVGMFGGGRRTMAKS